jgi:signal transduction histidine kinase
MGRQHRVELMGCDIHIESEQEKGTRMMIQAPLKQVND